MFELEYIKMHSEAVSQYEYVDTDEGVQEKIYLKGFASTDLLDREKDFVDPTSFDIPTFLNTPTLYLNHKPIADAYGNDHEAGKIMTAVPSYISEEKESQWVVREIESNKYVSLWPKSKAPNMVVGDRGLFVLAEVTHPMAISKVKAGVVGGFSWRGYTQQVQYDNGVTELKAIDLVEISIVDTPCQPQSTHMVVDKEDEFYKEVSLKGYEVVSVNINTEDMNLASALEQVKSLQSKNFAITKNPYNLQGFTLSKKSLTNGLSPDFSFSIKLSDKTVVLAPKKEHSHPKEVPSSGAKEKTLTKEIFMSTINPDSEKKGETEAVKLFLLDQEAILSRIPNVQISHAKSTTLDGVAVDMHTLVIPTEEAKEEAAESIKSEEAVLEVVEVAEEAVAEVVVEAEAEAVAEVEVEAEITEEVEAEVEAEVVAEVETEAVIEEKSEEAPAEESSEKSEAVAEVEIEAEVEVEVEAEVEVEIVAEVEAPAEVAEVEVEAVEETEPAAEVEAEIVSEEAPAENLTEEVAQVVEEVAEKSDIAILTDVVKELNLKVQSVVSENEKLRKEISDKADQAILAEKKAKELSEQKEELDRLANLFSTTTPSKDEAIVAESTKSTPAVESFNAVNSLFQIKQGN